jgi:phosphoglycolate phosphatase
MSELSYGTVPTLLMPSVLTNAPSAPPTPIRAVLFDLDGTLLHTAPDLAAAANATLRDLGLSQLPEARIAQFVGKGVPVLVARCLAAARGEPIPSSVSPAVPGNTHGKGVSSDAMALQTQAVEIYHRHYHQMNGQYATLYPGVVEGLESLKSQGVRLGVVTNKPEAFTHPLLKQFELARFMSVVVGGDTCATKKPDPAPMRYACEKLGVPPEDALMVGDSGNDCLAARAAGMRVWVLPYGYNEGQPVEQLDCDGIVESLVDVARRVAGSA